MFERLISVVQEELSGWLLISDKSTVNHSRFIGLLTSLRGVLGEINKLLWCISAYSYVKMCEGLEGQYSHFNIHLLLFVLSIFLLYMIENNCHLTITSIRGSSRSNLTHRWKHFVWCSFIIFPYRNKHTSINHSVRQKDCRRRSQMSCTELWPWLHWPRLESTETSPLRLTSPMPHFLSLIIKHDICWVLVFTWTNCTCILFTKAEISEMWSISFISKGFFWFLHHLLLYIFLLTSFVLFRFLGQTGLISLFSLNLSVIPEGEELFTVTFCQSLTQHIMLDSSTDLFFFGSFFFLFSASSFFIIILAKLLQKKTNKKLVLQSKLYLMSLHYHNVIEKFQPHLLMFLLKVL